MIGTIVTDIIDAAEIAAESYQAIGGVIVAVLVFSLAVKFARRAVAATSESQFETSSEELEDDGGMRLICGVDDLTDEERAFAAAGFPGVEDEMSDEQAYDSIQDLIDSGDFETADTICNERGFNKLDFSWH